MTTWTNHSNQVSILLVLNSSFVVQAFLLKPFLQSFEWPIMEGTQNSIFLKLFLLPSSRFSFWTEITSRSSGFDTIRELWEKKSEGISRRLSIKLKQMMIYIIIKKILKKMNKEENKLQPNKETKTRNKNNRITRNRLTEIRKKKRVYIYLCERLK